MCVQYIGGGRGGERECSVRRGGGGCSVHRGDIMSTSGVFITLGGCSVHWEDIMSTSGGYHEYIGGFMMHVGDTMSTSWDVQYIRRYHEYIRGMS